MTEKYNREKKREGGKYISRNESQTEQIIYRLKNIFIQNIVKDLRFIAICLRNDHLMLHNLN